MFQEALGIKPECRMVRLKYLKPELNPPCYPARQALAPSEISWEVYVCAYIPPYFVADSVLKNDCEKNPQERVDSDPEDVSKVDHDFVSFEGNVLFDRNGFPLNPMGRTGIVGRGLLGRWGRNVVVCPLISRINREGLFEILLVQGKNDDFWVLPGDVKNGNESCMDALPRVLKEKTRLDLDFCGATTYYEGYVDDPRNTDNAWVEVVCMGLHFDCENETPLNPIGFGNIQKAEWVSMARVVSLSLHVSYDLILLKAFGKIKETGLVSKCGGLIPADIQLGLAIEHFDNFKMFNRR